MLKSDKTSSDLATDSTITIIENTFIVIFLLLSLITTIIGYQTDSSFWEWAYDRHSNPLSWIIRPLFIPIYAYFAYRRNLIGLLTTIIAIITSMYWFPIPANPDPNILHFLAEEQAYFVEDWTLVKIIWSSLVPITMALLAYAFWKQSVFWGLIVVNIIAFLKITWSVLEDPSSGWILIPFAIFGLIISDFLIIYFSRKRGIKILPTKNN